MVLSCFFVGEDILLLSCFIYLFFVVPLLTYDVTKFPSKFLCLLYSSAHVLYIKNMDSMNETLHRGKIYEIITVILST